MLIGEYFNFVFDLKFNISFQMHCFCFMWFVQNQFCFRIKILISKSNRSVTMFTFILIFKNISMNIILILKYFNYFRVCFFHSRDQVLLSNLRMFNLRPSATRKLY